MPPALNFHVTSDTSRLIGLKDAGPTRTMPICKPALGPTTASQVSGMKAIALGAAVCLAFPAVSWAAEVPSALLVGKWVGLSRNIYSIYGDLSVDKEAMEFTKQGKFHFSVLRSSGDYLVVKLDRSLNCGRFVALGPVTVASMEFAVYRSEGEALLSQENKAYCSWGIYAR